MSEVLRGGDYPNLESRHPEDLHHRPLVMNPAASMIYRKIAVSSNTGIERQVNDKLLPVRKPKSRGYLGSLGNFAGGLPRLRNAKAV